jgi:hypothetical protein
VQILNRNYVFKRTRICESHHHLLIETPAILIAKAREGLIKDPQLASNDTLRNVEYFMEFI